MPDIKPFRPYRYDPDRVPDLGAVIAPPYDVISDEKRRALIARDPHNVIRLILPDGNDDAKYRDAADLYRSWITGGLLTREREEALYPYRQRFTHPVTGEAVERLGFITCVRLSPFSEGKVLPHERTLSGPKADRLKLMTATDANLEAIFGIYADESGESRERIARATDADPIVDAVDADGVAHTLWRLTDPEAATAIAADLREVPVYIVDGHHRYETALEYARLRREAAEGSTEGGHDWIMIFLAPMSDGGLLILPTHRVVGSLAEFDLEKMSAGIAEAFEVEEFGDREEGLRALESSADRPSFLAASGGRFLLLRLRDDAAIDSLVDPSLPGPVKELDVTLLHEFILERVLGITKEAQAAQTNLRYVKSAAEAFAAADEPGTQVVFLMNATRLEQVVDVAGTGSVMPQKSTYFYPKLASGLLFNPLGKAE